MNRLDQSQPAPQWAIRMQRLTQWLVEDCLGGPRPWKFSWVINVQKAGTPVFLLLLMWWYGEWGTAAWIYWALHGGYGMVWLIKDVAFPDPAWQKRITIVGGINAFLGVLGWYWLFGWLLIAGYGGDYPLDDALWLGINSFVCVLGIAIMLASDAQKYFTLKYHSGLISTGMFRYIRHPNYLGEMLIYGSLAMLVWHWLAFVVLAWVWLGVFAVNMRIKEARMSRHPEWAQWRANSWWLIPGVF